MNSIHNKHLSKNLNWKVNEFSVKLFSKATDGIAIGTKPNCPTDSIGVYSPKTIIRKRYNISASNELMSE